MGVWIGTCRDEERKSFRPYWGGDNKYKDNKDRECGGPIFFLFDVKFILLGQTYVCDLILCCT